MQDVITTSRAAVEISTGEIASLSIDEIESLHFDEMVEIVLASGMPVRDRQQLPMCEGDTIMRLVYMAREFCRRQEA